MRHTLVAMAVGAGAVALTLRFAPIKELAPDQLAGLLALACVALAAMIHAVRGKAEQ